MSTENEFETLIRQNNQNLNQKMLLNSKYEVLERVGKGGMGKVYRARDIFLKREVAVKEFSPEFPSDMSSEIDSNIWQELESAFVQEATILANLRHECLPTVFEFFTENRSNYLVMEYVEGNDLDKWARELRTNNQWRNIYDGRFPVNKVRQWAEDLLRVLVYLHEREFPIFHRDIKPANLKLRNDKICLLDFGLAKESLRTVSSFSLADKTLQGFTKGFAPIEQIYGEKTTAQTDIYGLSATLYYLLTGEIPIDGWTRRDDLRNGKPDPLTHVKNVRPEIDDNFARIVMQGLAVESYQRPRSVREMLEILRQEKVNESNTENKKTPEFSFDPSLTQPSPSINPVNPTLNLTPSSPPSVPYNPTPLINSNPNVSKRRNFIFALVGGAIFCVLSIVGIILGLSTIPSETGNSNQPATVSSSKDNQLLSEQKLYENPRLSSNPVGTLPRGAKVQEDFSREEATGTWYKVKSGSQEGWILCKKGEKCFSSQ